MNNYLIIGASSGIGKQLSKSLLPLGHNVSGTYHSNSAKSDLSEMDFRYLDIMESELNFDYLPEKLNGLAYCPGSINLKPFYRISPEEFVTDYNFYVIGAVKTIQALLPKLKKPEISSIGLFSTVAVQSGYNFHSLISSSKGAIEGLTRALAAEFAPKIRVNCIAPSLTDTPLVENLINTDIKKSANAQRHPLKRIGNALDIANMAEFLLTDKSNWITGQIFHVDSGISTLKI